jgi:hypothetical protein
MRLVDMAHSWALGTHDAYQGKLTVIRNFEASFGFRFLQPTKLVRPPSGPEIPLMWCQEAYSIRPGSSRRTSGDKTLTLAFTTIRGLRSAASQYLAWDMMVSNPATVLDHQQRVLVQPCRPTDSIGYSFHAKGMASRIGDEAQPSLPLLDCHVRYLDADLDRRYQLATTATIRRTMALAGFANLTLWLGWLRSSETFGLHWKDLVVTEPEDGPLADLPIGCGALSYTLLPETKSSRTRCADLIVAYETLSGYQIGKWFHRARISSGIDVPWFDNNAPIFCHPDGAPWTSLYFRTTFLYPSLHTQQQAGDSYLRPYTGGLGNSLGAKMWSLHCYRRGGRSHVSRGGVYGRRRFKKATSTQVYEHARWRRRRSGEAIDVAYREWTSRDKIKLTLHSM